MKAMMKIYTVFIITTLFVFNNSLISQTTNSNSNWDNPREWRDNNAWVGNAPGYSLNNNTNINIQAGHNLFIKDGQNLTLQGGGNDKIINISGNLVIRESLIVTTNNWEINVLEGGSLIVLGNIEFNQAGQGDGASPDLTINGSVSVQGDFKGTGNVYGLGNLYVDGEIENGIGTGTFEGIIAEETPASEIPAPVMGPGAVTRDNANHRMFYLEWEFDTDRKYTIEGQVYEFAGFRVIRNLDGKNHSENIVRGYFIYDGNTFEGFDNTVLSNSYIDIITDADIIAGVEGINTVEDIKDQNIYPEYYVRAVFVKSEDGSKNLDRSDYLLSPNSEATPSNQPLPIELLHFSAKAEGQSVTIQWATAAEINNDFFTLERSMDGNNWEVVTYVYGAGNSNYVINYEYTDEFPLEGISYYRLKQTDFDGQFEYFSPVAVYFSHLTSNTEIVNVRSNRNSLYIQYTNETPGAIMVVADIRGRILGNFNVQAADFVQDVTIDLPGNYTGEVVMIRLVASGSSDERKLVIR